MVSKSLIILFIAFFLASTLVFISVAYLFIAHNTIFSVFNLVLVFFSVAVLLIMLDLEFFALIHLALYVGSVIVFFLFTLMTINLRFDDTLNYLDEVKADSGVSYILFLLMSTIFNNLCFVNFGYLSSIKSLAIFKINYFLANKMYRFSNEENYDFWENFLLGTKFVANTGHFKILSKVNASSKEAVTYNYVLSGLKFRDPSLIKKGGWDTNFYHAECVNNLLNRLGANSGYLNKVYAVDSLINSHSGLICFWTKFKFYNDIYAVSSSIFTEILPLFILIAALLLLSMIVALKFAITSR